MLGHSVSPLLESEAEILFEQGMMISISAVSDEIFIELQINVYWRLLENWRIDELRMQCSEKSEHIKYIRWKTNTRVAFCLGGVVKVSMKIKKNGWAYIELHRHVECGN
jgi:hypothetical protein